jgi:hypothetical protein
MNERIKELVRESHLDVYGLGKERYKWEYTVEKFAELIVRECMNVVDPGQNQVIARFQARQWLAEHFGVKE